MQMVLEKILSIGLRTGMSRLEEKNPESSNSIIETVGFNRESILAACNFKS